MKIVLRGVSVETKEHIGKLPKGPRPSPSIKNRCVYDVTKLQFPYE